MEFTEVLAVEADEVCAGKICLLRQLLDSDTKDKNRQDVPALRSGLRTYRPSDLLKYC
jgi:hypothetical protein